MDKPVVLEHAPVPAGLRDSGVDQLQRRRIYIFPTRQGFIYLLMLIIMLLGAANYNNSMAYILTFMLGSMFMVAMLHCYRNLRGMIIHVNPAPPVFSGDTAGFPILIDNRLGYKRISIVVTGGLKRGKPRSGNPGSITLNFPAGTLYSSQLRIPATTRGRLTPGRIRISSTFPSGLLRAWSYFDSDQTCIVYPRPAGIRQLPDCSDYTLEEQTGIKTGTDDFTGFKTYRPGDSIRNIDWKVYARGQELLVKRFSGRGSDKLLLKWDQCAHIKDVEGRLSQLCLWVIEADQQGFYYGIEIPSVKSGIDYGEAHKHKCLRALAEYGID